MQLFKTKHSRTPPISLLLGAQTAFNIGFYAVVPFIAFILAQNFALGASAVGIILGLRTFAQQGMFLLGGTFADHFGARSVLLWGVFIRVSGFLALGLSSSTAHPNLAIFIAGTVLTGLGGALFSPALNLYIAQADQYLSAQKFQSAQQRITLFAWLNVTGEMGAVVGPLIGYALIGLGFSTVAISGAAFFAFLWLIFWLVLPKIVLSGQRKSGIFEQSSEIISRVGTVVKDRTFTRFALFHSVDLFCYNQLYFALPMVVAVIPGDSSGTLATAFTCVSVLILAGQVPISKFITRFSMQHILRLGYSISALSMLLFAVAQIFASSSTAHVLVIVAALLIGTGHLISSPQTLNHVSRYAPTGSQAAYLGFIATCGGIAVLLGNLLLGSIYDLFVRYAPNLCWLVWVLTAVLVFIASLCQRSLSSKDPSEINRA